MATNDALHLPDQKRPLEQHLSLFVAVLVYNHAVLPSPDRQYEAVTIAIPGKFQSRTLDCKSRSSALYHHGFCLGYTDTVPPWDGRWAMPFQANSCHARHRRRCGEAQGFRVICVTCVTHKLYVLKLFPKLALATEYLVTSDFLENR